MTKKIALVTGAGGGLGTEVTRQLTARGSLLYASDISMEKMSHLDGHTDQPS